MTGRAKTATNRRGHPSRAATHTANRKPLRKTRNIPERDAPAPHRHHPRRRHPPKTKVTGPFVAGMALASNDSIPNQVVKVNLRNGKLTPFVRNLQTAKGLVYLDASGAEPVLSLGAAQTAAGAAAASSATNGAAGPAGSTAGGSSTIASTPVKAAHVSGESDTLVTILAIAAIVLALGVGAFSLANRRRPSP